MGDSPGMDSRRAAPGSELHKRFSEAIMNFNAELSGCRTGALVQVWMPEPCHNGSTSLQTQGLPFSISGVGDMLALFRIVSCRYRFAADASRPETMGEIARVYVSGEPEMCDDVQEYDKSLYVRVEHAQHCRVHSTLVLPIFTSPTRHKPVAVIEISHHEKNVQFATVINRMAAHLEAVGLYTTDIDTSNLRVGLGKRIVNASSMAEAIVKTDSPVIVTADEEQLTGYNNQWPDTGNRGDLAGATEYCTSQQGLVTQQQIQPEHRMQSGFPHMGSIPSVHLPATKQRMTRSVSGPIFATGTPREGVTELQQRPALQSVSSLQAKLPEHSSTSSAGVPVQQTRKDHVLSDIAQPQLQGAPEKLTPGKSEMDELELQGTIPCHGSVAVSSSAAQSLTSSSEISEGSGPDEGVKEGESSVQGCLSEKNSDGRNKNEQIEKDCSSNAVTSRKNDNRLGGGAGKRLTFKDLQACFGVGLKDAAARLGICPTTLKRACRRNGISRWPSRQIAKLNKAWNQMGYQGSPPSWLLHNAITGNLKCENLAFAMNAGLHFGLMANGQHIDGAQPISCPQPQQSISAMAVQQPLSAPSSLGFLSDSDGLNMRSSSTQCLLSSPDQHDFMDEMDDILEEPLGNRTWHGAGHMSSLLHPPGSNVRHDTNSLLQPPAQVTGPFHAYFHDFGEHCHCNIEGQHRQQNEQHSSVVTSFDGLADACTADISLTNALNFESLGNMIGDPMDMTQSASDLGMPSRLF